MADPRQVLKDFSIMGSTLRPLNNMNASAMVERLKARQMLELRRQPDNPAHANAVLVMYGQYALGYLPRGLADKIAPLMDSGVKVICRKAPNALYGVCQLAYLPPEPPAPEPTETLGQLPEGITQEDIDTATDLPPLGDSRRPTEEVPHDEPSTDAPGEPG